MWLLLVLNYDNFKFNITATRQKTVYYNSCKTCLSFSLAYLLDLFFLEAINATQNWAVLILNKKIKIIVLYDITDYYTTCYYMHFF